MARPRPNARRVGIVSGLVVVASSSLMIAVWLGDVLRAPGDGRRVDALVERVKTDPGVAPLLLEERERQTELSLAHERLGRVLAWVLLVSGAVFVAAGKQHMSLRPRRLPSLDALTTVRFPAAPPPARGQPGRRQPDGSPAAAVDDQGAFDPTFVDELIARTGRGREAAIPILQAIQTHYRYLPAEALERVCQRTEITPAQIAGTSSFYAQFRRSPVGRHVVRVCHGTACHVAGAEQITQELRRHLRVEPGADTDPRRLFTIDAVACVGCCSLAPVMMIEDETAGRLTPATARQTLDALEPRA